MYMYIRFHYLCGITDLHTCICTHVGVYIQYIYTKLGSDSEARWNYSCWYLVWGSAIPTPPTCTCTCNNRIPINWWDNFIMRKYIVHVKYCCYWLVSISEYVIWCRNMWKSPHQVLLLSYVFAAATMTSTSLYDH